MPKTQRSAYRGDNFARVDIDALPIPPRAPGDRKLAQGRYELEVIAQLDGKRKGTTLRYATLAACYKVAAALDNDHVYIVHRSATNGWSSVVLNDRKDGVWEHPVAEEA